MPSPRPKRLRSPRPKRLRSPRPKPGLRSSRPKPPLLPNPNLSSPVSVAITGGIGAGKSETLRAFARHGAATISSDEIVHDLIATDPEVRAALAERFGTTDRTEIGRVVFADRRELEWLEALLHPRVVTRYLAWRERQTAPLTVTEVPLLYETGGDERFDKVVVITAPKDVRDARRTPFPGDRELRLLPDDEKAKRGDFVYENTGSLQQLDAFVADVVAKITGS
jgi:dephospho-CoA kinase